MAPWTTAGRRPALRASAGSPTEPSARQRGVHGGHLLAQPLRLLLDAVHLDLGPEVVAAGDQTRLLEAPHDDAGRLGVDAAERRERTGRDVDPPAALDPGERREEGRDLALPGRAERNQPLAPAEVGAAVQNDALGILPVPARAPRLLDVGGEAPGTLEWITNRTFGLSTPIPKAMVATTTASSSVMNRS